MRGGPRIGGGTVTGSEWLELLKQIPFHEHEARLVIGTEMAKAQSRELLGLLQSGKVCSLAGLSTRPSR